MSDLSVERQNMKIAYIHAMSFPSTEANAFDAIWTASALSQKVDTTFFMPRLRTSKVELKQHYGISEAPLRLQSLYLNLLPDRFLLKFRNYYEWVLVLYLRFHPRWAGYRGAKILYVRHPKALLFWGLLRERQTWLKDWILCYESHDPFGLDPNQFHGANPFDVKNGPDGQHRQAVLLAAKNFDVIMCNTQVLADDLRSWTKNEIQPHFIAIASPLPRLPEPPKIRSFGEKIVLGYIGTIDQYRGVHILLRAMRFLPENFSLRIVGRFRQEGGVDSEWFNKCLQDPQIGNRVELKEPVPIQDVAREIDLCDIVLQPASNDILDSRYATPQKSFDYMVRGKPIVAGDVPCHRELFQDGKTAALYCLDPKSFADCVINLVNNPALAEQIARGAWEQAVEYNPQRRVSEILFLIEKIVERRLLVNKGGSSALP